MPRDEWGKATARQKGRRELLQRVLEAKDGGASAHAVDDSSSIPRSRASKSGAGRGSNRGKKLVRRRREVFPACSLVELRRMLGRVPAQSNDKSPISRAICFERLGNDDVIVRPDLTILRTRSFHDLYVPITRAAGDYQKDGQFTVVPSWAWLTTLEAFRSRGFEIKELADRSVPAPRAAAATDARLARSLRDLAARLEKGLLSAAEAKIVARLMGEATTRP
ncbi:MAG: hypothetical protein FD180_142 [Planctomycetota bacterium]|nr:MAG: hypothetical protein FD180_142 [Planctomycetota bacterium]